MKKIYSVIICAAVLCLTLCPTALAARDSGFMNGMREAADTAKDKVEEAITDIKDKESGMLDPENGEPEAEGDGIVDKDNKDDKDTSNRDTTDRDTTDKSTTAKDTTSRDTTNRTEDTTGVIDSMELEEKGINPWAIVIAVAAVIAVLVLIFLLIPRKRR